MASGERRIDARTVGFDVSRDLHRAILKMFGMPEDDGYSPSYRRALQEVTAGYELTAQDFRELAEEQELALEVRHAKREGRKVAKIREMTKKELAGITKEVTRAQKARINKNK